MISHECHAICMICSSKQAMKLGSGEAIEDCPMTKDGSVLFVLTLWDVMVPLSVSVRRP
jgi:hypothetical protein